MMMKQVIFGCFLILISSPIFSQQTLQESNVKKTELKPVHKKVKRDPHSRQLRELSVNAAEKEKINAANSFNFKMLQEVMKGNSSENIMISPLSLSIALSMTANGAKGETQTEIYHTLQHSTDPASSNNYYRELLHKLPAIDTQVTLNIANSVWYRSSFKVLPSFIDQAEKQYNAAVKSLDFDSRQAPDIINKWVTDHTHGKINKIVNQISPDMQMYLINAVYFKGQWAHQFKKTNTRKDVFHSTGGSEETDFMFTEHRFNSYQGEGFQMVELPYGNESYSMIVVLPENGKNAENILTDFVTNQNWEKAVAGLKSQQTRLWFPKFKFSYENTLNDELTALGIKTAFDTDADFSGISKDNKLLISEVKHKTFIEVNEEGMEAAAVTSVGVSLTSLPQYHDIKVDHPFLFFIRENESGTILFNGFIAKP